MELNTVKLDSKKMEDGTWWSLIRTDDGRISGAPIDAPGDGASIKLRPMGMAYQRAHEEALKPLREVIRKGALPDEAATKAAGQALAEAVVVDWQGLTLNGAAFPYSREHAAQILTDAQWLSFREFIAWAAEQRTVAIAEDESAAAGNSEALSVGNCDTGKKSDSSAG